MIADKTEPPGVRVYTWGQSSETEERESNHGRQLFGKSRGIGRHGGGEGREYININLGFKDFVNQTMFLCDKFPKEEVLRPEELLKKYHEERSALDAKIDTQLREIESILGIKIQE